MKTEIAAVLLTTSLTLSVRAEIPLKVVYPPPNHETTADRIFLIGTAPPNAEVTINGQTVGDRSPAGHFAPSLPLNVGENTFTVRAGEQTLVITVKRQSTQPLVPAGIGFAPDSLTPGVNLARLPGELVCFSAIAPPQAQVAVTVGTQVVTLTEASPSANLPPNAALLTLSNQPTASSLAGNYQGCTTFSTPGNLGHPLFEVRKGGQVAQQKGPGTLEILSPSQLDAIAVTSTQGVARTGPSTDYSRLTPLPQGTQAQVIGREGEWLRLDYDGWIKASETQSLSRSTPPHSLIRSIRTRQVTGWTEVVFPLQVPVPVTVQQDDRTFTLTLSNTTAQTDTILQNRDRILDRLDWQQITPRQVQYTFHLTSDQQWGYKLRYEGTSLILSLRHPPTLQSRDRLSGVKILLDPGHGSANDLGSVGPTGYPEKDATLVISKLLQQELERRGATVILTRQGDEDILPQDRAAQIETTEPAIALSLHYNALPDNGDALNTQGIGTFWYHPQSHDLAQFLHDYLVQKLERSSYGVFWNNLALTRPTVAPTVLLELGFMINPQEFEWITNPQAQQQLAQTLADGITEWLMQRQ